MTTISKEQFLEYKRIQKLGLYNMLDFRARKLSNSPPLSEAQWLTIIENYDQLTEQYKN